ncbi:MAG: hypothetical protein ABI120_00670 [Gemmatimonadaceae bacterium]
MTQNVARKNLRRKIARSAGLIATTAMVAFASACSNDSLTAPDMQAKNGVVGNLLGDVGGVVDALIPVQALERDRAIGEIKRSFTVTRSNGGKLEIDQAGLRIDVPAEAISASSLVITVTVLPGKSVAYDFQPHGTKFLKPLAFRQDLEGTSWDKADFKGTINGGYFKNAGQLDLLRGLALLDELFPVEIKTHEARYNINHFSGYMVSSGRSGVTSSSEF